MQYCLDIDLSVSCRLCLRVETTETITNVNYSIRQQVLEYLQIEIKDEDEMPQKVCKECIKSLADWSSFQAHCKENDLKLKSFLELRNTASKNRETSIMSDQPVTPEAEDIIQVVDPKMEYSSSESDNDEDENVESRDQDSSQENSQTKDFLEVAITTISTEPLQKNLISDSDIIYEAPCIEDSFIDYDETMNDSEAETSQDLSELNEVDDNIMQDIIVAVLGDPEHHEINLPTIEDVCEPLILIDNVQEKDRHIRTFEPSNFFICKFCDASFETKVESEKHEEELHNGVFRYPCSDCHGKFIERQKLIDHLKTIHKYKKPYKCFHCQKNFKKQMELKRHSIRHAGWIKPYVCGICEKRFTRRNNLRHHLKIHTGERFACSLCSKSFSTQHALKEHEDNHKNSQDYKCSLCGLILTRKRRLFEHERNCLKKSINQIAPENVMVVNLDPSSNVPVAEDNYPSFETNIPNEMDMEYTCDQCPKRFSKKKTLVHHKLTHNPELRSNVCTYCPKMFLRRHELERHINSVHQQTKNFTCEICDKSFSRKDKLLTHTKIHNK